MDFFSCCCVGPPCIVRCAIQAYRGGYSPAERRQLEADLHAGRLLAVCATNALELGIDVGQLDVTLHLGFPGSIASLRQQAGRAGRREQPSLAIVIAFDGPLDQHFMRHPEQLFQRQVRGSATAPLIVSGPTNHECCIALSLLLLLLLLLLAATCWPVLEQQPAQHHTHVSLATFGLSDAIAFVGYL